MLCLNGCKKSYDDDKDLQCKLLKLAYKEQFTTVQLKRVREIGNDPEMLRAYLYELATEYENMTKKQFENNVIDFDQFLKSLEMKIHYKLWRPPSKELRMAFAHDLDSTPPENSGRKCFTTGPGNTVIIFKYSNNDYLTTDFRNEITNESGIDTMIGPFARYAFLGFTKIRHERTDGVGISIEIDPLSNPKIYENSIY